MNRQFIRDAEQALGKPLGEFTWDELLALKAEQMHKLDTANAGLAVTEAALTVREDLDR